MNYEQAVAYIEDIPKFTEKHELSHTKDFLRRLGCPAQDRKMIHVAGTNGKGSVCAYIQAILMAEGKSVGLFTSPHLVCINERIRINSEQVSDEIFLSAFEKALSVASEMECAGIQHPSYFEFLFGIGMTVFSQTDVEYVILETGLGGKLDATNVVLRPVLTVITSISLDHTGILGDTIDKIAQEKAGIIKEGVPVFVDAGSKEALCTIRRVAEEKNAPCREISKNAYEIEKITGKYIDFSRGYAYDEDITWRVPSSGIYEVMNAAIAIEAAEYVLDGVQRHKRLWQKALSQVRWEGRMEEAAPGVTVDGAHNPGAISAFIESVHARHKSHVDQIVLIFSAVSDKKYEQMIEMLCSGLPAKAYVVTEITDERGAPAEELERIFRKYTKRKVICRHSLEKALNTARLEAGERGEIYCLGSLYLVGMAKKIIAGGYHAEF